MASFTLGKYVPYNSFVHRLDPRVKIFATIALMVCIFLDFTSISWALTFTVSALNLVVVIVLLMISRIKPLTILKSLKSLWFMLIMLMAIYCFMPTTSPTLPLAFELNGWKVYWDSFAMAGKILLRLVMMISVTMILTSTTKPLDITYALEWYMTPLKAIHFPAHEIAMTISIALRFIPTLLDDTSRVMKAQASRGVDFENGSIVKRVRGLTSLIIPLFVSAFIRSEELANAMECRGYDPQGKRTRYRILRWAGRDSLTLIVMVVLMAGLITLLATGFDPYSAIFGLELL